MQHSYGNSVLPAWFGWSEETHHAELTMDSELVSIVDVSFDADRPRFCLEGNEKELELAGVFRVLGYDQNGVLFGKQMRWEQYVQTNKSCEFESIK